MNDDEKYKPKRVLTTGVFDLVHLRHLELLNYCSSIDNDSWADRNTVIILLDTDERVKQNKGADRPINCFEDRREFLKLLGYPIVIGFSTEEEKNKLLNMADYHYFIKGGDYNLENLKERELLEKLGKKIVFFPYKKGYSTSSIVEKIRSL